MQMQEGRYTRYVPSFVPSFLPSFIRSFVRLFLWLALVSHAGASDSWQSRRCRALGASETKAQIAGGARWLVVDDALLLRSTTTTTTAERGI